MKTAPLPSPIAAAIPSAPMVNVTIMGQARKIAITATNGKAQVRMARPPTLSASVPPMGRIAVARTMKPAVLRPAFCGVSLNISVRKIGRYTPMATKPPNVRK